MTAQEAARSPYDGLSTFNVPYCPQHEWNTVDCDMWCAPLRDEMHRLDNGLRAYFAQRGYRFGMRDRTE